MKSLYLALSILFAISASGQNVSTKEIREAMNGEWLLRFENDSSESDTAVIISKVVLKLKGRKGKEIGYFKNKRKVKSKISWKFSRPDEDGNSTILFKGGIWVDDQDYSILKITTDTIFMKSCDKYDCDPAYLIRE